MASTRRASGSPARIFQVLAILAFMAFWPGGPAAAESVDEVVSCAQQNLPQTTAVQLVEVTAFDPAGDSRSLEAKIHFKREGEDDRRIRARVENPAEMRGAAYLMITQAGTDAMYMYLPATRKARRVTGGMLNTRMWGTDFSYEDFRQIQSVALRGERSALEDAEIDGRAARTVEIRPLPEDESSYERILWSVDRETCLPLRIEFFEYGDSARKRLTTDPGDFNRENGRWVARTLRMDDLVDGTFSTLRIVEAEYDTEIPSRVFQANRLGRER